MSSETYSEQETVWVHFGSESHQVIQLKVAEKMLQQMHRDYPMVFGRVLLEHMSGPEAVRKRGNGVSARP